MEIETVEGSLAASTDLDGVRVTHIQDELASGIDPSAEDLAITALADDEEHRREFLERLIEIGIGRL